MNRLMTLGCLAILVGAGCSHTVLSSPKQPGVVVVRKDKELADAVKMAQAELPKFIERLKHPKPGDHFAIQSRFRSRMNFEHMWVDHIEFDGVLFHGTLADEPNIIQKLHKGERVNFPKTAVSDWLIINGDQREGGFAEKILRAKQGS